MDQSAIEGLTEYPVSSLFASVVLELFLFISPCLIQDCRRSRCLFYIIDEAYGFPV